jgi:glycosyltransferase involved in cell wall biosynthesis
MSDSLNEGLLDWSGPALTILIASPPASAQGPVPGLSHLLADRLGSLGCAVEAADWGSGADRSATAGRAVSRMKDLLGIWLRARRSPWDVVVVNTAHNWATLARDIPLMLGLCAISPARVIQFHGSQPDVLLKKGRPLFRVATRMLLATASAIMVLSTEEKHAWQQFRPKTKVYVVKNPHLASASTPEPADLVTNTTPIVLFVGRLMAQKGVFDLVQAAAVLESSAPELSFQIVMAGDGPEASSIVTRAQDLGVEDRVTLVGHVDSKALRRLYGGASLFVLPSYSEGFPTVIAEAMAAGLPIVTTAIRGAADYLEDGVNALLIPPGEPPQLADALGRLLRDPALCRSMGEDNLKKVTLFAPERVAAEYLEVLLEIVGT